MKCTSCSTTLKPVVAMDIDGTAAPFHEHFIRFAENYLDVRHFDTLPTEFIYSGTKPFREWFQEIYYIDDATWKQIKLAYRQGGMKRTMPAYQHAVQLTRFICGQGAELWLTTSRPAYRLDNIDPDTQEWCRRHGVQFDYALYDDDKYDTLAQRVDPARVIAVLDDLGDMYDAALVRFGPDVPILVKDVWNRGVHRKTEVPVNNLAVPAEIISSRILAWEETHS